MIEQLPDPTPVANTEPVQEDFTYRLLVGHRRTNGTWKTGPQLRMEYLQLTDELINKMTEGLFVEDPETGEKTKEKPDVVVWLDKSARPLAWLTKDLWPRMAADPETGEVPPRPDFKFVNIDRQQWVNMVDPEGVGIMDIRRVDDSVIRSLRSIFVSPNLKRDGLTPEIDKAPSSLDNKTIMIVDEVYSTGRTLAYAQAFFRRAFPTARVGAAYWMSGVAFKGGGKGNADLPVWYKEGFEPGRGVGNRNDRASAASKNITQRLGSYFLSIRLREPDPLSQGLREELHQLAVNPDVPVLPSIWRTDKTDRFKRYSSYNGGMSPEDVLQAKRTIQAKR